MSRKSTCAAAMIVAVASLFAAGSLQSQDFPRKPVRLVVANTPGIQPDLAARIVATEMQKNLGQPIVVENKPGADSRIGYEYVAKQVPADGYTLGFVTVSALALFPATQKDLRFDPLKDLPPIIGLVEGRYVFGSAAQLPWKTFAELVAQVKANPGKFNFGSSSITSRIPVEILLRDTGLNVVHVPYSGGSAYINALQTGEVQMGIAGEGTAVSFGDKFRVLAITGEKRREKLADVPTFAELGHPQITGVSYSLNAPVGVPKPVIETLHAAAARALQQPEVRSQYAKLNLDVTAQPPEAAAKRLADEARIFSEIVKKIGIQPK